MFREKNSLHDMRDLKHHLAGVSVSPDTFAALFPQADSPASAQDLLSRIKQEDPPCVWAQQELAERDIPTDPNSGERAFGARGDDFCNRQKIYPIESLWSKASERLGINYSVFLRW